MTPNLIPLNSVSTRRFQPTLDLDSIQIATPCRADWDAMSGDDQVRHCKSCAKNVYNLSALTRAQAVRLIEETEGHLCVQLHRREDGTLLTADCTVGISSFKKSSSAVRNLFAAAMAAVLSVLGVSGARASDSKPTPTLGAPRMGDVSMVPTKPAPVKNAPMLMGEPMMVKPMMVKPMMVKPMMVKPMMVKPMMGKPRIPVAPIKAVTLGRMVMPPKKKAPKTHAKHTSPSAAHPDGATRHQRHRG